MPLKTMGCGCECCVSDADVEFWFEQNGVNVDFYDLTVAGGAAIVSWAWTFGDGATSTLQNPSHTYSPTVSTGYEVTLTVTDENGCQASKTRFLYIQIGTEGCAFARQNGDILTYADMDVTTLTCAVEFTLANNVCGSCTAIDGAYILPWTVIGITSGWFASAAAGCGPQIAYFRVFMICQADQRFTSLLWSEDGSTASANRLFRITAPDTDPWYLDMDYFLPANNGGTRCDGVGTCRLRIYE